MLPTFVSSTSLSSHPEGIVPLNQFFKALISSRLNTTVGRLSPSLSYSGNQVSSCAWVFGYHPFQKKLEPTVVGGGKVVSLGTRTISS